MRVAGIKMSNGVRSKDKWRHRPVSPSSSDNIVVTKRRDGKDGVNYSLNAYLGAVAGSLPHYNSSIFHFIFAFLSSGCHPPFSLPSSVGQRDPSLPGSLSPAGEA